jgi:hypothetical protein
MTTHCSSDSQNKSAMARLPVSRCTMEATLRRQINTLIGF